MTNAFAIDLFEPNKCEMKWNNRSDKQEGSAVRRYIGIRFDTDVRIRIDFRDVCTVALLCCYEERGKLFVFILKDKIRQGKELETFWRNHAILQKEDDSAKIIS